MPTESKTMVDQYGMRWGSLAVQGAAVASVTFAVVTLLNGDQSIRPLLLLLGACVLALVGAIVAALGCARGPWLSATILGSLISLLLGALVVYAIVSSLQILD